MKLIFTILTCSLFLNLFAQTQRLPAERNYYKPFDDRQSKEHGFDIEAGFVQLYDSIVSWRLLDGVLRYTFKTMNYEYLNQQRIKSTIYSWDENQWVFSYNTHWAYDENKRLIKFARIAYDTIYKESYKYDYNGNLIFMDIWSKGLADTLSLTDQLDQVFSPDGLLLQKIIHSYPNISGDPYAYRYNYSYYDNKSLKSVEIEEWEVFFWVSKLKENYTYTPEENLTTIIISLLLNGEWMINSKTVEKYNTAGKQILELYQSNHSGEFVNASRKIWEYDSSQALTLYLSEGWVNEAWEGMYRHTCINDNRGNLIKRIEEFYSNNQWIKDWIICESHDANNFLTGRSYRNVLYEPHYFDSTAYYFKPVLGLPEDQHVKINIYPNPVISEFSMEAPFQVEKIELYNTSGVKVKSLSHSSIIHNISDLPKGMYLLKVTSYNAVLCRKLMKI